MSDKDSLLILLLNIVNPLLRKKSPPLNFPILPKEKNGSKMKSHGATMTLQNKMINKLYSVEQNNNLPSLLNANLTHSYFLTYFPRDVSFACL